MIVLFGRERFTATIPWAELEPLLPGWELRTCRGAEVAEHLDGVDVYCNFGRPVDRELIEKGGFGLVQQFGVGLENVDVDAATEHGVYVSRLPGALTGNADNVADLAVLHVLALLRRFDESRAALAAGRWNEPVGRSLFDSTVLVIGLGAIGTALVRRLTGFGPRILAVREHPERGGDGVEHVYGADQLHEALGQADVVVCCAMMGAGNAGMFDAAAFAACRPGAVFVNVARGGMVDEPALLAALESGALAGAGLDVFATEPADPRSALLQHPDVIATPHVAGVSDAMFRRSGERFAENLRRFADGEQPQWTVNSPGRVRGR